jgi:formimidoylglutamate deiminase
MPTTFQPDYLYQEGQLQKGAPLVVSDDGLVMRESPMGAQVVPLSGKILLPGFVNGHSHAFQKLIRGRTEFLALQHRVDDFWTWRDAMYQIANALTPEDVFDVSRAAFLEMVLAGYTSVGEFHYLHHAPHGVPYADVHELSRQVLGAAASVGIRIALLRVVYERAGFRLPADARQLRFRDADVERSLALTQELAHRFTAATASFGLAPHSVRAVSPAGLRLVAQHHTGIVHMHVAEQPAEVQACLKENALSPVAYLESLGMLKPTFTAIHAVHITKEESRFLGQTEATVCACPSTERNLGDGIVEADTLVASGAFVSLGTDSHAQIDPFGEMRQLEGHLRLKRLRRNVLDDNNGTPSGVASTLLSMASYQGARSLGLNTGTLAPGEWADFITLDIDALQCAEDSLLANVVWSGTPATVRDVAVAGVFVVRNQQHVLAGEVPDAYRRVLQKLFI